MLVNQKYDYVSDFPLPLVELEKFITQKYGSGNEYDTHHYVNLNGDIVDEWDSQATSVSNYAYEDAINESKRRIKIVSINFINTLLKNFKTI
jgi:hypothetical protein